MIDDMHSWRLPGFGVGNVRRELEDVCAVLALESDRSHGELVGDPKAPQDGRFSRYCLHLYYERMECIVVLETCRELDHLLARCFNENFAGESPRFID